MHCRPLPSPPLPIKYSPGKQREKGGGEGQEGGREGGRKTAVQPCVTDISPVFPRAEETRQLSQIRPYLFIGGFDAASDWQNLKAQGITHVLNVVGLPNAPNLPYSKP